MEYKAQIDEVKSKLEGLRQYYYSEKGKMEQLKGRKSVLEEKLQSILNNIDVLEQVRLLLQKTAEFTRERSRQQIEQLVTNCLQYIFDSNLEFKIEISESRGRPEAEFFVVSNIDGDKIKTRPQEARGGGIVDIISLALRVAMLQSSAPDIEGPLILDEPAKHVSEEYIVHVAEFLKQVNIMFGRQIIMVTHNRHLGEAADRVFKVELIGNKSNVAIDS